MEIITGHQHFRGQCGAKRWCIVGLSTRQHNGCWQPHSSTWAPRGSIYRLGWSAKGYAGKRQCPVIISIPRTFRFILFIARRWPNAVWSHLQVCSRTSTVGSSNVGYVSQWPSPSCRPYFLRSPKKIAKVVRLLIDAVGALAVG
jgi:hypothetical protein